MFCYIRYERDPSQAEFETFKKESKVFIGKVGEHQAVMDAISVERGDIQTKLAESEREIVAKKSRLSVGLQTDLNSAQLEFNSQLQGLNQRRKDASSSETRKFSEIQGTTGNQVSDLDRKISGLIQKESDEKSRALSSLQDYHLQNFLRSHSIWDTWIPGIGAAYKTRLANYGFATAADIDWKVRRIRHRNVKETALMSWRQGLEYEARRSAPKLSPQDRLNIENKYRQERQNLESDKQRIQTQLNNQMASVRQYFADVRQTINQEEQQLRTVSRRRKLPFNKSTMQKL